MLSNDNRDDKIVHYECGHTDTDLPVDVVVVVVVYLQLPLTIIQIYR